MKKRFKSAAILAGAAALTLCACSEKQAESNNEATGNAAIENIMTRASVRQFTDRAIAPDTLETILKAGMAAPTAMNKQPWDFVVVTERAMLDSLMAAHPYSNLKTATAAIIVCGNMQKAIEGEGQANWILDCSAATENILLAAHALGLGAVWCGVYPTADRIAPVKTTLKLPSYIIPLNIISMGYPAGENQPKDKWNPDNVHYQQW
ncbi:MAG: nitroreductase family protein [Bacteroidales bacterium]|nr:nitroreductase family protein [Bacteroidales bacterium]